jgi:hypothetical protein
MHYNPQPQDDELNVSNTSWGANLDHFDIDDNANVRDRVKSKIKPRVEK